MAPSHLLSAVLTPQYSGILPWLVALVVVVGGLVVYGWFDLVRLHGVRVWALSSVCFTEAVRKRILWVTLPAIVGVIIVAQLSRPADAQDAIRQATKFCLFATGLVVTVTAVILACTNLPREIETRVIYTVVTKPTTRLEIVLGKVLGFARVSAAMILIMGIFTYAYLQVLNVSEIKYVRHLLSELPVAAPGRLSLEHYSQTGFLGTRSLEEPKQLEILGRPPGPSGTTKWIQGMQQEFFLVPFELTADQKDELLEAADHGTAYVMTTLHVQQHDPDTDEQKVIKQLGLRPPPKLANAPLGPELPSTEPTAQALAPIIPNPIPTTQPATQPETAPAAEKIVAPPPMVRVRLLDPNQRPISGGADPGNGYGVELHRPDKPDDAWYGPMTLTPDELRKIGSTGKFFVQVVGATPATDYGVDELPEAILIPTIGEPIKIFPPQFMGKPAQPEFYSFAARRGMRLRSRNGGKGPVAVYRFNNAAVEHPAGGSVALQVQVSVEKNGEVDDDSGYSLISLQVVNRKNGRASEPIEFAPELSQTRFFDIPASDVEGGDFDVLIRGLTASLWLGVDIDSVAVVTSDHSFLLNLFCSLLLLWLLSLLVVIVSVFCSTFLSWPIAVICTLLILLGHWGVVQLGDALEPGIGNRLMSDLRPSENTSVLHTVGNAVEGLASTLRFISGFLPDVEKFPVTDYIEKGVTIPLASVGGAIGVLLCYGLPLLVLSYVILRRKEVAP